MTLITQTSSCLRSIVRTPAVEARLTEWRDQGEDPRAVDERDAHPRPLIGGLCRASEAVTSVRADGVVRLEEQRLPVR